MPTSREPSRGVSLRRALRHSRGAVRRSRWAVVGRMGRGDGHRRRGGHGPSEVTCRIGGDRPGCDFRSRHSANGGTTPTPAPGACYGGSADTDRGPIRTRTAEGRNRAKRRRQHIGRPSTDVQGQGPAAAAYAGRDIERACLQLRHKPQHYFLAHSVTRLIGCAIGRPRYDHTGSRLSLLRQSSRSVWAKFTSITGKRIS